MKELSSDCIDKLNSIENTIANLGSKNYKQDTQIEQINKSIYEIKQTMQKLNGKIDSGLQAVYDELKERFDDISNGNFNPKSMQELKEQLHIMNVYLMDSYKLQAEKDKILVSLKAEMETTKRSKFGFWKAVIVAVITVLGVKVCEWISALV